VKELSLNSSINLEKTQTLALSRET